MSTTGIQSSLTGLGSLGYISTTGLESSLIGLGTLGYISTTGLTSSLTGLGRIRSPISCRDSLSDLEERVFNSQLDHQSGCSQHLSSGGVSGACPGSSFSENFRIHKVRSETAICDNIYTHSVWCFRSKLDAELDLGRDVGSIYPFELFRLF